MKKTKMKIEIDVIKDFIYNIDPDSKDDPEFINFKKNCSATGTTEESIANSEKIGFKTDLFAINPLDS